MRLMAELIYYCGTMDSGKSTLALQTAHNHQSRGRTGLIFTNKDRAGSGVISSRLGLSSPAIEVNPDLDIHKMVVDKLSMGERVDYIICDEAQFYESVQIDQLARVVDGLGIDVFAFGILADFRTKLFPGSARLVELADRVNTLQVEALCWCGSRATHNARTVGGVMVVEGELLTKFYAADITCDKLLLVYRAQLTHHLSHYRSRSKYEIPWLCSVVS
jgi:thymidine kinase